MCQHLNDDQAYVVSISDLFIITLTYSFYNRSCAQFANLDIKMEKKYVVIAAPGMEEFAKALVATDSSRFTYFETQWRKFPDGTDNIYIGGFYPVDYIHDANVLFLASFYSNDATLSQYHALTMLCESFVDSMTILLPFYPTGTMERVLKKALVVLRTPWQRCSVTCLMLVVLRVSWCTIFTRCRISFITLTVGRSEKCVSFTHRSH